MANSVRFTYGTSNVPPTAGRIVADTTGGNVTLILPSIAEQSRFQQFGSGLNVAGTFNFAFEKIGSGQLIFNVGVDGDTINGSASVVINDIGSGIIFISGDGSWGIVNFSQSANQNNTSRINVSVEQFNASGADSPIVVVPAKADALVIASHIIISIVQANGDGSPVSVAYGYNGCSPIDTIDLTGLPAGAKVIVPIIAPQSYNTDPVSPTEPVGASFIFYKVSGSNTALKIFVPNFEIEGFVGN